METLNYYLHLFASFFLAWFGAPLVMVRGADNNIATWSNFKFRLFIDLICMEINLKLFALHFVHWGSCCFVGSSLVMAIYTHTAAELTFCYSCCCCCLFSSYCCYRSLSHPPSQAIVKSNGRIFGPKTASVGFFFLFRCSHCFSFTRIYFAHFYINVWV